MLEIYPVLDLKAKACEYLIGSCEATTASDFKYGFARWLDCVTPALPIPALLWVIEVDTYAIWLGVVYTVPEVGTLINASKVLPKHCRRIEVC